jgi:hypothetical protein
MNTTTSALQDTTSETDWSEATIAMNPRSIDDFAPGGRKRITGSMIRLATSRRIGTAHERVSGPFHGYYIVSRGSCVHVPRAEYVGSFKICQDRPDDFDTAHAKFIGWTGRAVTTSLAAMHLAEEAAMDRIVKTFASRRYSA